MAGLRRPSGAFGQLEYPTPPLHIAGSDLDDLLARVWVAGPGADNPGEPLPGITTPLSQQAAEAMAVSVGRRCTPTLGGFCIEQVVVDGGRCPKKNKLDCDNCDKLVMTGADLLYWRRKREQWHSIAERAPDDATAGYLHKVFEPTARAIDGLEKAPGWPGPSRPGPRPGPETAAGLLPPDLEHWLPRPGPHRHHRLLRNPAPMTTKTPPQRTTQAIQARRRQVETLLQRVRDAIAELHKDHARVTVSAVERRADVSRTFLYQNPDARALVAEAVARADGRRVQQRQQAADEVNATWRERALNAEDGLKQAVAEIQAQRKRIGELLGQIRDLELDLPADAVQRLATENTTLKQENQALTAENKRLTDRLAASHDNYRSQEREIANLQGLLLEHHPQAVARHLRPVDGS